MLDTIKTIYTHRSIREFKPELVSGEDLKKIIEAGLRAPSSKNSCPWHFLVLRGKEKDEVADWAIENEENKKSGPISFETGEAPKTIPKEIRNTTNTSAGIVKNAPILFLIFNTAPYSVNRKTFVKNVNERNAYSFVSEVLGLGACMENILLACHALGLGAVSLADLYSAESKIKERYEIAYDFAIGIALGHPAYQPGKRDIHPEKHLDKFNADLIFD